ncbi:hypothetical protein N1851_000374 [Merluccius polli]|uniref:Uncharacterized protein n=1 Tax=Merluccius polli TaxID=89951 RepID=A0AA47PDZ5_MERPO|nr:hypothetical protein N1851_000374 [Merluccius polli]
MVSTVTESFFLEQFAPWGHDRLHSCHWLQLQAANGLAIPYIGYLELEVGLCGKVMPRCGILVVKDPPGVVSSVPGILGMNAPGPVITALQRCHQSSTQGPGDPTGTVRVRGKQAVRIPGGVMKLVASTCSQRFSGSPVVTPRVVSHVPATSPAPESASPPACSLSPTDQPTGRFDAQRAPFQSLWSGNVAQSDCSVDGSTATFNLILK